MKQTQQIKPRIPHGSHVDCSASLTKLTALQAPIPILSVCVCTPDLGFTGGNNDIAATPILSALVRPPSLFIGDTEHLERAPTFWLLHVKPHVVSACM